MDFIKSLHSSFSNEEYSIYYDFDDISDSHVLLVKGSIAQKDEFRILFMDFALNLADSIGEQVMFITPEEDYGNSNFQLIESYSITKFKDDSSINYSDLNGSDSIAYSNITDAFYAYESTEEISTEVGIEFAPAA